MASDDVYELCLPILQDDATDEDDKTDKLEELLKKETDLSGKALDNATLDVLWRFRNVSHPTSSSPAVRHTITRRHSPAPWQTSRGPTPVASSPRSAAASPAPTGPFANRPALLRMRSSQQASPFTSPRSSPRLPYLTPSLSKSPTLGPQPTTDTGGVGPDNFGDYDQDWLGGDDGTTSNASSTVGNEWGLGSEFAPQMSEMSPYDMMRSVLRGQKTDEEIETILEANGYNLSAAIMSLMGGDADASQILADKPFVGKGLEPAAGGSRPATPAGGGGGKSNIVCKYWLSTGQCLRADCKFSHDLSSHVCKYWLAGNCLAGDGCVFSHDPAALIDNLSLSESVPTPPLDMYSQSLSISDYSSFPSLSGSSGSPNKGEGSGLMARNAALAPEFVPGRSQSRPTSRHQSPGKLNRLSGSEDSEAFPSLGAAAALRGPKKHHGKRGHGHGHKDREPGSASSLADVVRLTPAAAAVAAASSSPQATRRGLKAKASYTESREESAAAQAIAAPEHIPWLETGERANKEYLKARQEAIRHGGARNKFLQSAAQAWNRNDVRAAKALSLRGQSENDLMREAHREAARHLYDLRNRSHGVRAGRGHEDEETYVDLHGLHPAEAVEYLDTALKNQRSARALHRDQSAILYAIVGTGHHSKGGRDKVGKAVRSYLVDARYAFREFSVAGSASGTGGGSGGILGIDAASSSGSAASAASAAAREHDDYHDGSSQQAQSSKIRILKADEVSRS